MIGCGIGITQVACRGGAAAFSPLSLFASGEEGAWYDPSDLSTLFQDAAGTTPVTADGHPVRLMLDKSGRGNHIASADDAARPAYRTNGTLHWLQFDGVDDRLFSANLVTNLAKDIFVAFAGGVPSNAAVNTTNAVLPGLNLARGAGDYIFAGLGVPVIGSARPAFQQLSNAATPSTVAFAASNGVTTDPGVNRVAMIQTKSTGFDWYSNTSGENTGGPWGNNVATGGGMSISNRSRLAATVPFLFHGGIVNARLADEATRTEVFSYLASKAGVTL